MVSKTWKKISFEFVLIFGLKKINSLTYIYLLPNSYCMCMSVGVSMFYNSILCSASRIIKGFKSFITFMVIISQDIYHILCAKASMVPVFF